MAAGPTYKDDIYTRQPFSMQKGYLHGCRASFTNGFIHGNSMQIWLYTRLSDLHIKIAIYTAAVCNVKKGLTGLHIKLLNTRQPSAIQLGYIYVS